MGRGPKWTDSEDVELVRSWISIAEQGATEKQKGDLFWTLLQRDLQERGVCCGRSIKALKNRWLVVDRAVQKFCEYYHAFSDTSSSNSYEDQLLMSEKQYYIKEQETFSWRQAWEMLMECNKWPVQSSIKRSASPTDILTEGTKNTKVARVVKTESSSSCNTSTKKLPTTTTSRSIYQTTPAYMTTPRAFVGSPRNPRILLCVSGSIAAVKVPELAVRLVEFAEVKIVVTKSSSFFLRRAQEYDPTHWELFNNLAETIPLLKDENEWASWNAIGDPVLHIDLKEWADIMLLAPMSANTLAKVAQGLSDNLLTSIARAWMLSKPFLFAPAMNTDMWNHPLTRKHLDVLEHELQYKMIPPVEKKLACGVIGNGGLANIDTIVNNLKLELSIGIPSATEKPI